MGYKVGYIVAYRNSNKGGSFGRITNFVTVDSYNRGVYQVDWIINPDHNPNGPYTADDLIIRNDMESCIEAYTTPNTHLRLLQAVVVAPYLLISTSIATARKALEDVARKALEDVGFEVKSIRISHSETEELPPRN